MKRIGMKKASYMVLFLVMGMIFAVGCSKKPDEGGDIILSSADNTQSQENTGTTEPATEETSVEVVTEETTDEATQETTTETVTETTTETVTEITTEPVTETTQQPVEEVKPWDLLNNEPLNPTTSGYEELDRLIEAYMTMLKNEGTISDDMSPYQKVHSIYVWFIKRITYNRGMNVDAGKYSTSDPETTPEEVLWATDLFNTYQGCCYNYSSAFMYIMRYLGYDAHLLSGQVSSYNGGTTPHCWLYVNLGGEAYTFDPDVDMNYYWRGVKEGSTEEKTDTLFCRRMEDMSYFYTIEKYHEN